MSRNRKPHRKNRTFHLESLERRELMSAVPWTTEGDVPNSFAADVVAQQINATLLANHTTTVTADALSAAARSLAASTGTPGTQDASFSGDGKLTKHFFTTEDRAYAVAVQGSGPDAKYIVVGQIGDDVGVARFHANGNLDMTFGDWDPQRKKYMGFTKLNFSGYHESGNGVAIDQDTGRIFIAATINSGNEAAVICLTRDGKLDHGFGEKVNGGRKGYRTIDFGGGTDQAFDLAIDSRKRIVVVGAVDALKCAVARLTANGDLDLSFGYAGQRTFPFGGGGGRNYATAVAIDSNDTIFVVGRAHTYGYGVARLSLDGKVIAASAINFGNGTEAYDVAIDGEGRLVVVGTLWNGRGFGIARLSPHFVLDKSFSLKPGVSSDGKIAIDWGGSDGARSVAIDPHDNGIYVVGRAWTTGFGIVRLTDTGALDRNFSTYGDDPGPGQATVRFANGTRAFGVTLDNERRVVVVGDTPTGDFALARLHGTPLVVPGTITIEPKVTVNEAAGTVEIKVTLDRGTIGNKNVTVDYRLVPGTAGKDDYGPGKLPPNSIQRPTGTLHFGTSKTEATIVIPIKNDAVYEGTESFQVKLGNPTTGVNLGNDTATIVINDDDPKPPFHPGDGDPVTPTNFSIQSKGTAKIKEGSAGAKTVFTFTISRTGNTSGRMTVGYWVTGSGANPASAADFVGGKLPSGEVTFQVGQRTKEIKIEVAGDAQAEPDENFTVTLLHMTADGDVATASATATIANDDTPPFHPGDDSNDPPTGPDGNPGTGTPGGDKPSNPGAGGGGGPHTPPTPPPFTAELKNGTLKITANQPGRAFVVNQQGNKLVVSTPESAGGKIFKNFRLASVKAIEFHGTTGNDRFVNNTSIASTAYGGDGNDTLIGGGGNDKLYGQNGRDTIQGRGGNDHLDGGAGRDTLRGGAGNDKLVAKDGTYGNDVIDGGAGKNTVVDDAKPTVAVPKPDPMPEAKLTNGRLVIQGNVNANDVSVSQAGKEVVVSWGGREKRFAAASVKVIEFRGGAGNDKFTNNTSIAAEAYGDEGNDTLIGGSGNDVLRGGAGNDWIEGRGGNDILHGDDGNDTIQGGAGDDRLYGGNQDDHLDGGAGSDRIEGGSGNDGMYGGDGRDFLFGQEGNDWLYGGFGNDELYGGKGDDHLYGNEDADYLDGQDGNDKLYGDQGSDRLVSRDQTAGNDQLFGGLGADTFDAPTAEIKQR